MKTPRCERKGTVPHAATHALTWDLPSGRMTKYFCDEHSKDGGPLPHYIWNLIGYFERAKTATDEE
jgi:hypothetical protein